MHQHTEGRRRIRAGSAANPDAVSVQRHVKVLPEMARIDASCVQLTRSRRAVEKARRNERAETRAKLVIFAENSELRVLAGLSGTRFNADC